MFSRRLLDSCSAAVAPIDALAGGLVQLFFSGLGQPRAASDSGALEPVLIANKRARLQGGLRGIEDAVAPRRAVYEACGPALPMCSARLGSASLGRSVRPTRRSRARAYIRRAARALMEPRRTNR